MHNHVRPAKHAPKKTKIRCHDKHMGKFVKPIWELISSELRIKWEVTQEAYEVVKEKDRMIMRLEEFKFLGFNMKEMEPHVVYWIEMEKKKIREEYNLQTPHK